MLSWSRGPHRPPSLWRIRTFALAVCAGLGYRPATRHTGQLQAKARGMQTLALVNIRRLQLPEVTK